MKNKFLVSIGGIVFIAMMMININFSDNATNDNLALSSIVKLVDANAEIPIHLSDGYCTCKNGVCQDGNWIGFRETCGTGDSDYACSLPGGGHYCN